MKEVIRKRHVEGLKELLDLGMKVDSPVGTTALEISVMFRYPVQHNNMDQVCSSFLSFIISITKPLLLDHTMLIGKGGKDNPQVCPSTIYHTACHTKNNGTDYIE